MNVLSIYLESSADGHTLLALLMGHRSHNHGSTDQILPLSIHAYAVNDQDSQGQFCFFELSSNFQSHRSTLLVRKCDVSSIEIPKNSRLWYIPSRGAEPTTTAGRSRVSRQWTASRSCMPLIDSTTQLVTIVKQIIVQASYLISMNETTLHLNEMGKQSFL